MKTTRPLIMTLVVSVGCAGAIWFITQSPPEPQLPDRDSTGMQPGAAELPSVTTTPSLPEATTSVSIPDVPVVVETPVPLPQAPPPEPPKKIAEAKLKGAGTPGEQPARPRSKKERLDPVARVALIWVGADPEAEEYWIDAINDARLSGHERSDLIEDLNEEGFPDPKNPTFDDLPLIVNRLQLIEELAPDAMDQVNWDAFAEAKKDLMNMAWRALQ